jgi:four helix bundle protein
MPDELKIRTKSFAHRCVKMASALPNSTLGNHIKGQIIRCATSVAANYRAASVAQSKPSFVAKLSIVVEEADEALFWLEFISDEKLLGKSKLSPLLKEADELTAIFVAARKTAQKRK